MFSTQVLREDLSEDVLEKDDDVEVVGLVHVCDKIYEIKKGETKIGRDPTACSVVIDNCTVSKVHAVIESDGIEDTFIYDVNSTNQTKLGKKVLRPHCRYKLENDSKIVLGNITLTFKLPCNEINPLELKPTLENFISPNALEDIFEIPTQVSIPQPQTSREVPQFEKVPENVPIFKVPNSVVAETSLKDCPRLMRDSTDETKCRLDSQDLVLRTDYCNNSVNASGIFSLSTQCQIIPSASEEHKPEDVSIDLKTNESDKIKSLLNDGQDDVLCTFMSLHSPGGQAPNELPVKIKTEIIEEDLSHVFDVETQVQAVVQPSGEKILEEAVQIKEELHTQNSHQPTITSVSINNVESSVSEEISNNSPEEDFIKTQEFNTSSKAHVSSPDVDNALEQSDIECYFEKTLDFSAPEGENIEEDLISTQNFEAPDEGTRKSIHENEELNGIEEDFMATQLYDFEKERTERVAETAGKADSFAVSESPKKKESCEKTSTDLTQINAEEDFISTQVFDEITSVGNAGNNAGGNGSAGRDDEDDGGNDNEDFIATQSADLLVKSAAKNVCFQKPHSEIQTASRESSPDLLDSEFCAKFSEDVIDTATFENPERPTSKTSLSEFSEKINSMFSTEVKKEFNEDFDCPMRIAETVESSGDETESDLEIIFDKSHTSNKKLEELSLKSERSRGGSQQCETGMNAGSLGAEENDDDHSSYVFQLEPEPEIEGTDQQNVSHPKKADDSDSDATDCEEIVVVNHKMSIKQEPPEKVTFDETQVLTLTPPSNLVQASILKEGWITDKENSKSEDENDIECWSQLSLAMPNTQDMESVINRIVRSENKAQEPDGEKSAESRTRSKMMKTEAGSEIFESTPGKPKRQNDSPLKRPGNSNGQVEVVPTKKPKTETSDRRLRSSEKQFLKLWQEHDIEQIRPSRTRNSLRNAVEKQSHKTDISLRNNVPHDLPTSRRKSSVKNKDTRKLSHDITSYLCKKVENKRTSREGRKKETPPKENRMEPNSMEICQRVLRSSRRNSGSTGSDKSFEPSRRSSRSSRLKSGDYFKNSCVRVVFTGFDCESLENIISVLGGKKASDLSSGDVVVADKVRRTVKFLSAVGLSMPITSPQWLMSCMAEKRFLNPWDFILKDEEAEKRWNFELKASLERSAREKLMQGLSVYATKNAKPPVKDLLAIVECCGGTPIFDPPEIWPKKTVIVSCLEDEISWPLARLRNIKIVHYEFILSGVLAQKLDFKTYRLR